MARKEKEGLLDFFLNARRSLVEQWLRDLPISELRKIAEERFASRKMLPGRYLGDVLNSKACAQIFEYIFDAEFLAPFGRVQRPISGVSESGACALFLPPEQGILSLGQESAVEWTQFLAAVPQKTLCLRTGFLSTEFDVLETVALGFDGLCVHARTLDLYEIQLLTEICRDFRITLVAIADSPATVERILESDCPYIGLWGYDVQNFAPNFGQLSRLSPKIPSTCYRVGFLPSRPQPQWDVLQSMGVSYCVW